MGFSREFRLLAVDVIRNLRRQNGIHAALSCFLGCLVCTHPCHDGDVVAQRLRIAVEHFVPENEVTLLVGRFLRNVFLELFVEIDLQVAVVLRTDFGQQFLAVLILFPFRCGTFVATQVNVAEGEDIRQFINHILGKLHGLGIGHVDDIGRYSLPEPHLVLHAGVASQEVGIRSHGCL